MAFSKALLQNTPSKMFDMALNIPVDYLSCVAMVLKGTHGNVDIWQTDYSIYYNPRIFFLFWSHTWKCNVQANKSLTKVKEK